MCCDLLGFELQNSEKQRTLPHPCSKVDEIEAILSFTSSIISISPSMLKKKIFLRFVLMFLSSII